MHRQNLACSRMADHSHRLCGDRNRAEPTRWLHSNDWRAITGPMPLQPAIDQTTAQGPTASGAFAAAQWTEQLLVGPLGTSLAVIAVAWFGFGLLAGRFSLRRGGLLVLGCFVLFGAPSIARGLIGLVYSGGQTAALPPQKIAVPPPPVAVSPPPFDPYAGASVPGAGN